MATSDLKSLRESAQRCIDELHGLLEALDRDPCSEDAEAGASHDRLLEQLRARQSELQDHLRRARQADASTSEGLTPPAESAWVQLENSARAVSRELARRLGNREVSLDSQSNDAPRDRSTGRPRGRRS